MIMGWSDAVRRMNDKVLAAFGEDAVYTPFGGTAKPVRAVQTQVDLTVSGRKYGRPVAKIGVSGSDVPRPQDGDTVEMGGMKWTVRVDGVDFQALLVEGFWTVWATGSTE